MDVNPGIEFIEILGFDINDLSKTVSDDDFKIRIEDIKDAFNDEYNNICYKFNCKIRHKNFVDLEDKDSSAFIKKIRYKSHRNFKSFKPDRTNTQRLSFHQGRGFLHDS
jgi:hypothetical protein